MLKDFETVLMFYGYDLSVDMVSATPVNATTESVDVVNTTMASNATAEEMQTDTTTVKESETTTEIPSTTTESAKETTTMPTTTTTAATTTTEEATTTTEAEATTTEADAADAAAASGEAEEPTTEVAGEEDAAELVSAFVAEEDAEPFLRIQKARVSRLPTSKLQAPLKHSNPITPKPIYLPSARIAVMPIMAREVTAPMQRKTTTAATTAAGGGRQAPSTTTTAMPRGNTTRKAKMARHKRHVLGYKDLDANLFVALFSPHAPHSPLQTPPLHSLPVPATAGFAHITNEFEPHYISDGSESKTNYNADVISHVFYLSSQQVVHTTFKVYNAVLYYKYFEHLKLSVLELELDTPEYNLIILLPDYHMDIVAAAASLKLGPTLRLMRKQLKPRWVQAIIPDFKLHGTMFLTNDLQNVIMISSGLFL